MTDGLYDNNNKKYKMINECDPVINNKNVKHQIFKILKRILFKLYVQNTTRDMKCVCAI